MNNVDHLARKIWDYMHMGHMLKKADLIMVLGSIDTRVADRGAELFLAGWAPRMLFSGTGFGHKEKQDLLATEWVEAEADVFAKIAMKKGVPAESILIENKSRNTGENVQFCRKLLQEKGITPRTIIVVQKPYMERRTYATFKAFWPEPDIVVTSQEISFDEYMIPRELNINIMVGDLQRIREYPRLGFQIPQEIPADVWDAYEKLVAAGYNKHLISVV